MKNRPDTMRLARQSNWFMIHAAIKGQRDPDTLEEADKALQKVPNWAGLNH